MLALAFLLVASWLQPRLSIQPSGRPKGPRSPWWFLKTCNADAAARLVVEEAARRYKIPVVAHDFPLPMHNWSYDAAVIARYFDSQSKELGIAFRDYIFQHQPEITPPTCAGLRKSLPPTTKWNSPSWSIRKADSPQLDQDKNTGQRVRINHTPKFMWSATRRRASPSSKS